MNRFLKMNRFFKSCLLASAGLVFLAATLSLTTPGRAFAQRVKDDCIRICDTASNPLHVIVNGITRVKGEVTINNENAIATTVSGPVQVTTSRGEPLYVVQRLKVDDVFQEQVTLTLKPGEDLATQNFVVPADQFLEIKNASGTLTDKAEQQGAETSIFQVRVAVLQTNNSGFFFPLFQQYQGETFTNGVPVVTYQINGNQVGIFATPTDTVQVQLVRIFSTGNNESKLELAITGKYHGI